MNNNQLCRSVLFMPAHIERYIDNGIISDADILVFDIEDGVPFDKKETARAIIKRKLKTCKTTKPLFIRINSRDSGMMEKGIEKLSCSSVNGFILTKVKTKYDILYVEKLLNKIEKIKGIKSNRIKIIPLIEVCEGVLNVLDIAKASKRNIALIFGHEDFLADLQIENDCNVLRIPKMMVAMAARAAGIQPINSPYLHIKDAKGCVKHIKESLKLGFCGMMVLHPTQIRFANKEFLPSKEKIDWAQKIIALDEIGMKNGRSVTYSNGCFVAPPIVKRAKNIISIVEYSKKMGDSLFRRK